MWRVAYKMHVCIKYTPYGTMYAFNLCVYVLYEYVMQIKNVFNGAILI